MVLTSKALANHVQRIRPSSSIVIRTGESANLNRQSNALAIIVLWCHTEHWQ